MKTFVESFCLQVFEHHLIGDIVTAFDRVNVGTLTDVELLQFAAKSHYANDHRNNLQAVPKHLKSVFRSPGEQSPIS
jgi:hypothetical protein